MAILSKGTDFSTGDQVTAANLDALVDSATFAAGAVDDSTTALDSSSPQKIIVKNGGIGTTQLATSDSTTTGVTFEKMQHVAANTVLVRDANSEGDISAQPVTNKQILIGNGNGFTAAILSGDATMTNAGAVTIADDAVTNAKLADDAVNSAQIENGAIDKVHMSANSVDSDQYVDGSIDKVHIAAGALTDLVYPVGSIFTTVNNYGSSSAVVSAIGGTTWTAFGSGRVLVGQNSSDSDFNTVEEEGGFKTVTLTSAQSGVPAHAHKFRITGDSTVDSGKSGGIVVSGGIGGGDTVNGVTGTPTDTEGQQIGGNTAADAASSHTNLQPYVVVYMWKRTA